MREDGYYWVKLTENSEWEIMEWNNNSFMRFADEFAFYTDNDLFEIDEKIIVR
jgi:hypothetical protein